MSEDDTRLETTIGWILVIGVLASVVFESVGLALNYSQTHDLSLTLSPAWNVQSRNFFSFVVTALPSVVTAPSAVSLVSLGIILLMLTPYARVVASVVYYGVIRDYRYLGITLLVLTIITISLIAF